MSQYIKLLFKIMEHVESWDVLILRMYRNFGMLFLYFIQQKPRYSSECLDIMMNTNRPDTQPTSEVYSHVDI